MDPRAALRHRHVNVCARPRLTSSAVWRPRPKRGPAVHGRVLLLRLTPPLNARRARLSCCLLGCFESSELGSGVDKCCSGALSGLARETAPRMRRSCRTEKRLWSSALGAMYIARACVLGESQHARGEALGWQSSVGLGRKLINDYNGVLHTSICYAVWSAAVIKHLLPIFVDKTSDPIESWQGCAEWTCEEYTGCREREACQIFGRGMGLCGTTYRTPVAEKNSATSHLPCENGTGESCLDILVSQSDAPIRSCRQLIHERHFGMKCSNIYAPVRSYPQLLHKRNFNGKSPCTFPRCHRKNIFNLAYQTFPVPIS